MELLPLPAAAGSSPYRHVGVQQGRVPSLTVTDTEEGSLQTLLHAVIKSVKLVEPANAAVALDIFFLFIPLGKDHTFFLYLKNLLDVCQNYLQWLCPHFSCLFVFC